MMIRIEVLRKGVVGEPRPIEVQTFNDENVTDARNFFISCTGGYETYSVRWEKYPNE